MRFEPPELGQPLDHLEVVFSLHEILLLTIQFYIHLLGPIFLFIFFFQKVRAQDSPVLDSIDQVKFFALWYGQEVGGFQGHPLPELVAFLVVVVENTLMVGQPALGGEMKLASVWPVGEQKRVWRVRGWVVLVAGRRLLESEDLGTADDATQGQQSLGYGHLDRLDEALSTHDSVAARERLHGCFGTDTNGALKDKNIRYRYLLIDIKFFFV